VTGKTGRAKTISGFPAYLGRRKDGRVWGTASKRSKKNWRVRIVAFLHLKGGGGAGGGGDVRSLDEK